MTDSIPITPGAGVSIEVITQSDGDKRQVVAIRGAGDNDADVIGALTETAPATDTASSGLNGRLQRVAQRLTSLLTGIVLAAGTAIIGKVGIDQTTPGTTNRVDAGKAFLVKVAPTVTAGAYTADDCMGGEMTITAAARESGGGGILTGITMVAEDNDADGWGANDVEVLIFDANPAGTYTDNNALNGSALTDADATLLVGTVLLDTYVDLGDITMLKATGLLIPYVCSGSANLFAVAVNRGAVTPEATDAIQFTFHLLRD